MHKFALVLAAFGVRNSLAVSSYIDSLSDNAKELFTESMDWMDTYYDSRASYLYDFSAAAALRHETRSSAWYAFGLLARNKGHDVSEAEKIIRGIISGQYKDPADEWYGTYQKAPEEPLVGSTTYPADIYNTWDPNWRGFIGTTFIMALEEFPKLISKPTQELMLESLHNATKGDEYRFGNLDPKKDNLYPSYSNPAIMRAFMSGWTGRRLKESNMTRSGERYAQDIIYLFNRANTLSEFNSGTYTGVSLYGLTLWSKYLPKDSIMAKNGPDMIKHTWEAVGNLWHPGMKNMAGPWDRSYGYDMNRYLSLMALWFWAFIGKESSSLIQKPQVMSHMADYAWAPLFAALAKSHQKLIPKQILADLTTFKGEHNFTASTFYPPFDTVPRNISTWVSKDLTIGAQSYRQISLGGPAQSQEAYNPAVIQWDTGKEVSFISLYPSETALDVEVSPGKLRLSYPRGNSSSVFTLLVGTFIDKPTITSWDDLPNLRVNVSGNTDPEFQLSFGGAFGGSSQTLRDFELWNFTYTMPSSFQDVPALTLDLETSL
ncbi:hypothetical protein FVEN_g3136 [Fusarium venenatum]|uniref:Linalool dehydratase/isomerase domain-containing protein n=1 Tax=Fusarium venenatum TaxID=56646 RepID=A0A2L2T3C3_9HYPO|nr:uncharacterized protein FVRRES_06539 [Fusarium venenatum]KAG8359199.1 hypothetical protein FVEN_g3136 [Fusarium venenatum]KAH6993528.1 hypothetical protein EDB82DRAFT_499375 [Fusarium venenatum]CEI62103.1 unnamed protein product [Fusarium venenatum]